MDGYEEVILRSMFKIIKLKLVFCLKKVVLYVATGILFHFLLGKQVMSVVGQKHQEGFNVSMSWRRFLKPASCWFMSKKTVSWTFERILRDGLYIFLGFGPKKRPLNVFGSAQKTTSQPRKALP